MSIVKSNPLARRKSPSEIREVFEGYVEKVSADKGHRDYCAPAIQAIERHINDLKRKDVTFDISKGVDACRFMEKLKPHEGSWKEPTIVLADWQVFIICSIFSWYRTDEPNKRRFNEAYIEIPRKNGKSTLAAAIMLYTLCLSEDASPVCLCAATTGDQAERVFNPAKFMAATNAGLSKRFNLEILQTMIRCRLNNGIMRTVNSRSRSQEGHNPSVVCFDELHAHESPEMYNVLKFGAGQRDNHLFLSITTAGNDIHSICFDIRKAVTGILNETFELDHMFGIIFTLDKNDDPHDMKVWAKSNPMLHSPSDISPRLTEALSKFDKESIINPSNEEEYIRKRHNIWIENADAYFNAKAFSAHPCVIGDFPDEDYLNDLPSAVGFDLSSRTDLTAIACAWRDIDHEDGDIIWLKTYFWLPEEAYNLARLDARQPWAMWRKRKYLSVMPGEMIDYDELLKFFYRLTERYTLPNVVFDPWNSYHLVHNLSQNGFITHNFNQSIKNYNEPMKEWKKRIFDGSLRHPKNEIMDWCVGNVVPRYDSNMNVAPDKKNCHGKIDGAVAGLMATAVLDSDQVYNTSVDNLIRVCR